MNFRRIQQCLCNHEQRIEELEEGESGILDAPEDGNTYGREDGEWVQVNEPAIIDSTISRSLVEDSASKTIIFTNGSAVTATIPNDTTHNHQVGTQISLIQSGTGLLTVDTESPATVNGVTSVDSQGQYSGILLVKTAANTWTSVGNV